MVAYSRPGASSEVLYDIVPVAETVHGMIVAHCSATAPSSFLRSQLSSRAVPASPLHPDSGWSSLFSKFAENPPAKIVFRVWSSRCHLGRKELLVSQRGNEGRNHAVELPDRKNEIRRNRQCESGSQSSRSLGQARYQGLRSSSHVGKWNSLRNKR